MQKQSSLPPAKPKAKPWFLYLVECQNGKIYTGITVDVDRRMNEHASGTGAKFTRANPITKLIAVLEFRDRSQASQAEYAVKQLSPDKKRLLAAGQLSLLQPKPARGW
jgi:putative endonuclease